MPLSHFNSILFIVEEKRSKLKSVEEPEFSDDETPIKKGHQEGKLFCLLSPFSVEIPLYINWHDLFIFYSSSKFQ